MINIYLADAQTCVKGNCMNGFGTMIMPDKSRYTGAVSYTHLDVYKRQTLDPAFKQNLGIK